MADAPAQPFLDMAARIEKNDPAEFAGAIVVVPPEGDPIAFMIADPSADLVQFWATCETRIAVRKAEIVEASRNQQGWVQR